LVLAMKTQLERLQKSRDESERLRKWGAAVLRPYKGI